MQAAHRAHLTAKPSAFHEVTLPPEKAKERLGLHETSYLRRSHFAKT